LFNARPQTVSTGVSGGGVRSIFETEGRGTGCGAGTGRWAETVAESAMIKTKRLIVALAHETDIT
jgi:hypothetical protein